MDAVDAMSRRASRTTRAREPFAESLSSMSSLRESDDAALAHVGADASAILTQPRARHTCPTVTPPARPLPQQRLAHERVSPRGMSPSDWVGRGRGRGSMRAGRCVADTPRLRCK